MDEHETRASIAAGASEKRDHLSTFVFIDVSVVVAVASCNCMLFESGGGCSLRNFHFASGISRMSPVLMSGSPLTVLVALARV